MRQLERGASGSSSDSDRGGDVALLFQGKTVERLADWSRGVPRLGRSSVLWIDLDNPDEDAVDDLAELLDLGTESRERLRDRSGGPRLVDFGAYLHVEAYAPSDARARELRRVVCLVSDRWVVTVHEGPMEVLETYRERAAGSGSVGDLVGLEFLANILEWALHSYLEAFEDIERMLEEIDATAMEGRVDSHEDALARLVGFRREIGKLRRALVSHREIVLALTRPELEAISDSSSADRFAQLRERIEEAVQASRDCREAVVGSFDVLIASTGQRTNEIMKVLTLASVLLLPGALVAGILGMNFQLPLFRDTAYFWLVLAAIAAFAVATIVAARLKAWV